MTSMLTSIAIFGLAMLGLAAGLILTRKALGHSCCGGEICDTHDRCDEPCDDCPNRDDPHWAEKKAGSCSRGSN